MYGPTCVVEFAMTVSSMPNLLNRILAELDVPPDHKKTTLASKSWGMNTAYTPTAALRAGLESGKTLADAERAEIETLQYIHCEPMAAEAQFMDTHDLGGHGPHSSFDVREYLSATRRGCVRSSSLP